MNKKDKAKLAKLLDKHGALVPGLHYSYQLCDCGMIGPLDTTEVFDHHFFGRDLYWGDEMSAAERQEILDIFGAATFATHTKMRAELPHLLLSMGFIDIAMQVSAWNRWIEDQVFEDEDPDDD